MDQYRHISLPQFENVLKNNPDYSGFVQIKIPANNNSVLHAIFKATSILYNDEETIIKDADGIEKVVRIYKNTLIDNERLKLSRLLSFPINSDPGSASHYEVAAKKSLSSSIANNVPDIYSISQMKKNLENIDKPINVEFLEFLALVYNVNIYILHQYTKDISQVGWAENNEHNNKKSIILLLCDHNHFDLIGVWYNNSIISVFGTKNPLTLELIARFEYLKNYES